jgi:nucleoside-diphosphate-sugar epimerase
LYKVGVSDKKHEDAWELGTGTNYSVNEVYEMFKEKFGSDSKYIPEQKGNYRVTLRENNDTVERLDWKPEDRLSDYIKSL